MSVYYNPEEFGLKPIAEYHDPDEDYSFDMIVIWQSLEDPEKFYWATDSGCSCPSPFENYNSLDRLQSGTHYEAMRASADWRYEHKVISINLF